MRKAGLAGGGSGSRGPALVGPAPEQSHAQASANFYRGLMSPEALPPEEEFQFLMTFHAVFLGFQNSYFLTEEGTLDQELLEALTAAILGVKDTPGMRRYWRQRKSYLHARFGAYVDELLTRETNTSMDVYRQPSTPRDSI